MTNLKLNATLKAYSKYPFYKDYVRGVNVNEQGQIENLDPNTLYGLRGGKWEKIFEGNLTETSDRLKQLEIQGERLVDSVNNIGLSFDVDNSQFIWCGSDGKPTYMSLLVSADNDYIKYNSDNKLTLVRVPDNITIVDDGDTFRADKLYVSTNLQGEKKYIDGTKIQSYMDIIDEMKHQLTTTNALRRVDIDLSDAYAYSSQQVNESNLQKVISSNVLLAINVVEDPNEDVSVHFIGLHVVDVYTGYSYVWNTSTQTWIRQNNRVTVSATNTGVDGVVAGSMWTNTGKYQDEWETDPSYLKGNIDNQTIVVDEQGKEYVSVDVNAKPTFHINGLKERLSNIDETKMGVIDNSNSKLDAVYVQLNGTNSSEGTVPNYVSYFSLHPDTIVKRTPEGRIKAQDPDPEQLDDVVTVGWLEKRLDKLFQQLNISNISSNGDSEGIQINNDGDITNSPDYLI